MQAVSAASGQKHAVSTPLTKFILAAAERG